jgi:hypothetical protein
MSYWVGVKRRWRVIKGDCFPSTPPKTVGFAAASITQSQAEAKGLVRVLCLDLAASYRALVRKHFHRRSLSPIGFK